MEDRWRAFVFFLFPIEIASGTEMKLNFLNDSQRSHTREEGTGCSWGEGSEDALRCPHPNTACLYPMGIRPDRPDVLTHGGKFPSDKL